MGCINIFIGFCHSFVTAVNSTCNDKCRSENYNDGMLHVMITVSVWSLVHGIINLLVIDIKTDVLPTDD